MKFADLGLSDELLQVVEASGYSEPTPIQAQAIPQVQMMKDLIAIAQTGTGKTASFVLPMIDILSHGRRRALMPRSLILEPTRELAAQVAENFEKYGKNHKLNVALLIGGVSFEEQDRKLERGADVLVGVGVGLALEVGHQRVDDEQLGLGGLDVLLHEGDRRRDGQRHRHAALVRVGLEDPHEPQVSPSCCQPGHDRVGHAVLGGEEDHPGGRPPLVVHREWVA